MHMNNWYRNAPEGSLWMVDKNRFMDFNVRTVDGFVEITFYATQRENGKWRILGMKPIFTQTMVYLGSADSSNDRFVFINGEHYVLINHMWAKEFLCAFSVNTPATNQSL